MRILFIISLFIISCNSPQRNHTLEGHTVSRHNTVPGRPYVEIKDSIVINRKNFSIKYASLATLNKKAALEEITNFWVNNISNELFNKWQHTPWDFNGTTEIPRQGTIACGYFVTTILRDMDCKINRSKLAVCASSQMMRSLVPNQKIKNLSYVNYAAFNDSISHLGKGVYIIGLDFHTGYIVNDGKENWFIHSYYVKRVGVIKEKVLDSWSLRSSKTRWLISLTNDTDFLYRWLKG
ncbi:MAG: hypothetical protein ABI402_07300 [Ferruginibacter sp.]